MTIMAASPVMEKLYNIVATSAIHDGERDREDYTGVCHPGTREEYLANLQAWANNTPPDTRVEWLNAIAGAGKTAMLRTFCTLLEERGRPPVSFFVWKGDAKRNALKHFPATIAYQLCQTFPVLFPLIEKAINAAPLLLQSTFKKQMDKLVIGPLLDARDTIKGEQHLIIVVDGLDELDPKGQTEFLDFIPYFLSRLSSLPISLLVSSRPDPQIVGAFNHPKLASITRATRLGASDADIRKFLEDKFEDINLRHPYLRIEHGGKWPGGVKLEIMVRQSSGLFIWPTVAIGHIDKVEKGLGHNARLDQVLSSAEKPWVGSPLDNLYRTILEAHAPEDRTSFAFFRFKRRLALLCIIDLGTFVRVSDSRVFDWSDAPVRAIFDETLDELWGSIAGLSSLFSPRKPLSNKESPTPGNLHRSLRDFTFNRERCGEELYYSSEGKLHAEIVCKFIKFFNTPQAYLSCTGMSAKLLSRTGEFLYSRLEEAMVSEELGCCMDDIVLNYIPGTWPFVTQMFAIAQLFESLYRLAKRPDFPEGFRRREALLSKVAAFIKIRVGNVQELDSALFRLALSTTEFLTHDINEHSVYCWCIAGSPQCTCIDAYMRCIRLDRYQGALRRSTLFQDAKSRLAEHRQVDIGQDCLFVLQSFLSLSEASPRPSQLSPFIQVNSDYWVIELLERCPPNEDLCNTLGSLCTTLLPELPKGEADYRFSHMVQLVLKQTKDIDAYAKRCQEAGIETKFPPIKIPDSWWEGPFRPRLLNFKYKPPFDIPDDWWQDQDTRNELLEQGFKPLFDTPDDWWQDQWTRHTLLEQGFKPPFDIPDDWWQDKWIRNGLLGQGFKPPFDIPDHWWQDQWTRDTLLKQRSEPPFDIPEDWWQHKETRQILRRTGHPPPDPYSAEETASESEDGESVVQEAGTDQHVSQQDESLPDGSPQFLPPPPPIVALSNPPHIRTVGLAPAHPTTTPAAGVGNGQVGPSNVVTGRRRRGVRDSLKNFFRR